MSDGAGIAEFTGRGWSLPLRVDARGGIALGRGHGEIEGAIRMILGTAPGERLMRPTFGCRIWDLVFDPVDPTTLGLMRQAVEEALGQWEPRIQVDAIHPRPDPEDPSRVTISIEYTINATNDVRNLVYPFYVIPRDEAEA